MKLDRIIDILGWYPDAVNNVEKEYKKAVRQVTKWKEDAEKFEMVDSLFAELEIPLPYDLWLAESLQIRERLKKLCHDNRNINGLLDLESFHGKVQKMVSTKEGREELAKYDVTADSW